MLVWKGGEWINPQTAQSFVCFSFSHPTGTQLNPYRLGNTSQSKQQPADKAGFYFGKDAK